MARINILIADSDEGYLGSIVDYISETNSQKFQLQVFSDEIALVHNLKTESLRPDIYLISLDLYKKGIVSDTSGIIVVMTPGNILLEEKDIFCINKYQHAEKFINQLLAIYADNHTGENLFLKGNSRTKVIGFCSAMGGVGKSTVAAALSVKLSKEGFSTLYLNLESIQSTNAFFNADTQQGMSNVIYYIKEKSKNLQLKLEAIRCLDQATGVYFFKNFDCLIDGKETSIDEYKYLLEQLIATAKYDFIILDLDSGLDNKIISLLDKCNLAFYIHNISKVSDEKKDLFEKELNIIRSKFKITLEEKLYLLINKVQMGYPIQADLALCGRSPLSLINRDSNINTYSIDEIKDSFGANLNDVVTLITGMEN